MFYLTSQIFYLNEFFPSSGSSLKEDTKNDLKWNYTRKLITLSPNKGFKILKVKTNTIDNFCKNENISGGIYASFNSRISFLRRDSFVRNNLLENHFLEWHFCSKQFVRRA